MKKAKEPKVKPSVFEPESPSENEESEQEEMQAEDAEEAEVEHEEADQPNASRSYDDDNEEQEEEEEHEEEPEVAPPKAKIAKSSSMEEPVEVAAGPSRNRTKRTLFSGAAPKIKIVIPMHEKRQANSDHPPLKQMLTEAVEKLNEKRGITWNDVKRYIHTTYEYMNDVALKKAIKARLDAGEFEKVTGIGLNGKFRLPPVKKHAKKEKAEKPEKAVKEKNSKKDVKEKAKVEKKKDGEKSRKKTSKAVATMSETKPDKRRKSLILQVPKAPKTAKVAKAPKVAKESKAEEKTKKKGKATTKGTKKAVVKSGKTGKVKITTEE